MAFHGFVIIEMPFHHKLSISIHMHISKRVIEAGDQLSTK
jgi:hypothetical protein